MRVVWTSEALQDRADIWDYIAADSPSAAARMDELFSVAAVRLTEHPNLGKPGKIPGTRELIPHETYRVVYEVGGHKVWILPLVHSPGRAKTATRKVKAITEGLCGHNFSASAISAINRWS